MKRGRKNLLDRRKVSVEGKVGRNVRPAASNLGEGERRLSARNLQPERSKGRPPEPIESRKPVESCVPKTRFTCRDLSVEARRSASLPRFKNFPPEQIRKSPRPISLRNEPSPDHQQPKRDQTFFVANQSENYGQGDAEITGRVPQQQASPGENASSNEPVGQTAQPPTNIEGQSSGKPGWCFPEGTGESAPPRNTGTNDPPYHSYSAGSYPLRIPPGRMFSCSNYECYRQIEPRSSLQHHREMQQRANNQRIIMNGQQYLYNSNVPHRSSESHCCSRVISSPQDYNAIVYPRQIVVPPSVPPNNRAELADDRLGKCCDATAPPNNGDCRIEREICEVPRCHDFHASQVGARREQDSAEKLTNEGARRKLEPEPETRKNPAARRRVFRFTADMIRDQEALVSAMRQQAVPEDIMKRQFDTLLNEQRKYLAFLEQMRQEIPEVKSSEPSGKQRAKDGQAEKPEWMIHITPPRPSYLISRYEPNDRSEGQKPSHTGTHPPVYQNSQQHSRGYDEHEEIPGEYARLPCNTVPRFNQQQIQAEPVAPYNGNQHPGCVHSGMAGLSRLHPHQHHYPHQHQFAGVLREPCENEPVNFGRQSESPVQPKHVGNSSGGGENPERPVEPCSLLRMKLYKEVIRPQRRNNGLQDIEAVSVNLMEKAKNPKHRLDGETEKYGAARLNGIQDPEQTRSEVEQRGVLVETPKRISANGLENSRNPNNPPQRRFARTSISNPEVVTEYPVQKTQKTKHGCQDAAARLPRETIQRTQSSINYPASAQTDQTSSRLIGNGFLGGGDVNSPDEKSDRQDRMNLNCTGDTTPQPQPQPQPQTQTRNKVTFQPEIQEPRIIGGITYLARKASYMPGMRNAPPEPRLPAIH